MFKHPTMKTQRIPWPYAVIAMACAWGAIDASAQTQDVTLYRFSAPNALVNYNTMTPFSHSLTMYGDMGYTKDSEYWRALLSSPHMARPRSTKVRAIDMFEHIRIQFRSPLDDKHLWIKNTTTPRVEVASGVADTASFPRYLKDGDLKGANVFEDTRTIAMDNDAMYWLCEDGTIRYYSRNGTENTSYSPATWTRFTDGPFSGEALADKIKHLIGVEGRIMRFLVNDTDVIHYQLQKQQASYTKTVSWKFTADPLKGRTLGEIVDGRVPGYAYLGWDNTGPIIASLTLSGNASANIPGIGEVTVTPGVRDEFPPTHHMGTVRIPEGGQALDADGNPLTDLAGNPIPDNSLITPDGFVIIQPTGVYTEIDDDGVITLAPGTIVIRLMPDSGRKETAFPDGGFYDPSLPERLTPLDDDDPPDPDGTIRLPGKDGERNTPDDIVISPKEPDGNAPTIDPGTGSVTIPEGGAEVVDGNSVPVTTPDGKELPEGTVITPGGTIILPGNDNDNGGKPDAPVIIPDQETSGNGTVIVPPGGTVVSPGGKPTELPDGGTVMLPGGAVEANIVEPVRITSIVLTGPDTPAITWMAPTNTGTVAGHIVYAKVKLTDAEWTPLYGGFILNADQTGATLPATLSRTEEPFRFFTKATIIRK